MFRTLYAKLSLSLFALLLTVGILYTLTSLSTAKYYLQETDQTLNLDLAKNLVTDRNLVKAGHLNEKALKDTFMEYMVINPSIELYLLDTEGKILAYSADEGKVKRNYVSLTPIRAFLNGEKLPLLGDDPRSHDRQKIFSVTPVPSEEKTEGYLYVVLLGEQYDEVEQFIKSNTIWKHTGWALLGSLSIGLVIGLLLFRKLTQRLEHLSNDMQQFRKDDFNQPPSSSVTVQNGDEVDALSNSFHEMATRIVTQMDELKQQDNLRRELVANVSHDLRTPVAVLHGYLETLQLKAQSLNETDRQHYVELALKSSNQLNQLINELFELAKLEAQESVPKRETFNLAELANDVVQKFQVKAQESDIKLSMHVDQTTPFVEGDIGLIARTFENLVSNAIKFTPGGGEVTLKIEQQDCNTIAHIDDTGPGIESEDIPKLFDRFYQGKSHNNRSTPGGLGLAIVKRIIELHNGEVGVENRKPQGASFYFKLPAAVC